MPWTPGTNVYVAHYTSSTDIPMVVRGFQQTFGGGGGEIIVWKISSGGQLLANTYLGGNGGEGVQGIVVDIAGNVYLSIPGTTSTDFPVTSNAYQSTNRGGGDAAWAKRLIWRLFARGARRRCRVGQALARPEPAPLRDLPGRKWIE